MFYALNYPGNEENYLADKIERFIALAPCAYGALDERFDTLDEIIDHYQKYLDNGIYFSGGTL